MLVCVIFKLNDILKLATATYKFISKYYGKMVFFFSNERLSKCGSDVTVQLFQCSCWRTRQLKAAGLSTTLPVLLIRLDDAFPLTVYTV